MNAPNGSDASHDPRLDGVLSEYIEALERGQDVSLESANILIDDHGRPHITDFGLAKRIADDSQITHTGAIVGTPSYMAPEQAKGHGRTVTTAADIYGLGAILYATLAKRPPFDGGSPLETLLQVQNELPERLSRLCPAIDRGLESICEKCLGKDPESRYRSAGELADDLDRWLDGEPLSIAPPGMTSLLWRWLSMNFRAAVSVLVLGLLTGIFASETPRIVLVHNLSPYLNIYRNVFPQHDPPWMLTAIAEYPRWFHWVAVPISVILYLGMGWLTDFIVMPKSTAAALLAGMGLGSAAALAAFLAGIGWMAINQEAVWRGQPDLELLAATIDHSTTFTNGRSLAEVYPQAPARQVMKKALIDIQVQIPLAICYGLMYSFGFFLLPATLQVWAAHVLRQRGDRGWQRLGELIELSVPITLLLIAWGFLVFNAPLLSLSFIAFPVCVGLSFERSRHWSPVNRHTASFAIITIGFVVLATSNRTLFSPATGGGGFSMGLLIVGAISAAIAVFQRWPWWGRLVVDAAWIATFTYIGGARRTFDADETNARMIASLIGSGVVVLLSGLVSWSCAIRNRRRDVGASTNQVSLQP